jgi:pyruvate/2-oxoglutarate dehydrogenase complex dihydrolipoamide acyltransferase (E2) component
MRFFPKIQKVYKGTTAVTSVGMFGTGSTSMIPLMPYTTSLSIGTIEKKPKLVDGKLVNHDFLNIVLSCDHDIIDGTVGVKFIERLKELVEQCYSLPAPA